MISAVVHLVVLYVIAIVASVSQNAYQDAINVIVLPAVALLIAIILVAVFAFALLASAILEEDATHLVTMSATMIAK